MTETDGKFGVIVHTSAALEAFRYEVHGGQEGSDWDFYIPELERVAAPLGVTIPSYMAGAWREH
jgi:hypothetical protein